MTVTHSHRGTLELFEDDAGSVILGWVAERVFYVRYTGVFSAQLGTAHIARLQEILPAVLSFQFFLDLSALTQYDLLARSAFTRLVLEQKRRFERLVVLTWSAGVTRSTEVFAAVVGDLVTVVNELSAFEKLLGAAAPLAAQKLDARAGVLKSDPGFIRR